MYRVRSGIICLLILFTIKCEGQDSLFFIGNHPAIAYKKDSGIYVFSIDRDICKGLFFYSGFTPNINTIKQNSVVLPAVITKVTSPRFLTVHGNISYDFYYRSRIDTPFAQKDLQQHTERVMLNITLKEKYPLNLAFTARQSNSPYFRNFIDPSLQFDQYSYLSRYKQNLVSQLMSKALQMPDIKKKEDSLLAEINKYKLLKLSIGNTTTLQKLIETKENKAVSNKGKFSANTNKIESESVIDFSKKNFKFLSKSDSALDAKGSEYSKKGDSLGNKLANDYEVRRHQLDSLYALVQKKQQEVDSLKRKYGNKLTDVIQKIYRAKNADEISKLAGEYGITELKASRFQKALGAIKNINLGKSTVNYTDLTIQNVLLTGINIEYNPSYYVAITAGKIDYRFRDFFNKGTKNNGQYVVMGRFGWGDKDKRALIFSFFKGRKNQSEYALSDSVVNHVNLVGYSLEAIYKRDEYNFLSLEVAKSTKPVTGNLTKNKQINNLWQFNDNSNMGINVKAQVKLPLTNTLIGGFFRKTGESFQSFSLFSYNSDQTSWQAKLEQVLLKNKVKAIIIFRRNDFTNPFTDKTFKTNTVFKSFVINVQIPRYPSVSLGYYPATQMYFINKDKIQENAYYLFNGTFNYSYKVNGVQMNSVALFNRYYNKATDSGFILNKGAAYYLSQIVFLRNFQVSGNYVYTDQPELKFYTIESALDYSFRNFCRVGAALKYNKVAGGEIFWGGKLSLGLDIKYLGVLRVQYEKSYLPTIGQNLFPIETGRVSWSKFF